MQLDNDPPPAKGALINGNANGNMGRTHIANGPVTSTFVRQLYYLVSIGFSMSLLLFAPGTGD